MAKKKKKKKHVYVNLDNYHDNFPIFISFKFKGRFLLCEICRYVFELLTLFQ